MIVDHFIYLIDVEYQLNFNNLFGFDDCTVRVWPGVTRDPMSIGTTQRMTHIETSIKPSPVS